LPAGEFYPGYFANPLARQRIRFHIPDCKILCTFRDPAARLYSTWRIIRARRLAVDASFDRYWRLMVARGSDLCRYAAHLQSWQREFGEERVLALFYEELNSDPQTYLDTVCDFVGIARVRLDDSPIGKAKVHSAWRAARATPLSQLAAKTYARLVEGGNKPLVKLMQNKAVRQVFRRSFVESFEPLSEVSAEEIRFIALSDTEELERITGRDLSSWKPRATKMEYDRFRISI